MKAEPAKVRFARYFEVDPILGCWNWTGSFRSGRGQFGMAKGQVFSAHRAAWELFKGSVPQGQYVVRNCLNPLCVNPEHHRLSKDGSQRVRTLIGDLMLKIQRNADTGCWEFMGGRNPAGYGHISHNNTTILAHRLSWELFNKTPLDGKMVCHKCDNPCCVNPNHLFLGTGYDNTEDMYEKKRREPAFIEAGTVGARLREIRKSLRLSLADVGSRLGVSRQLIQQWEKGSSVPRDDTVQRLAVVLDVDPQYILGSERKYLATIAGDGLSQFSITDEALTALREFSRRTGVSESEAIMQAISSLMRSENMP